MPSNRNQLCKCDSGLKFKKCHGNVIFKVEAEQAYKDKMQELINQAIEDKYKRLTEGVKNAEKKENRL